MHTIGFMGAGNMAGAILNGILSKKLCAPDRLFLFDVFPDKCTPFLQQGVYSASSGADLAARSDIIFLAVKPQNFPEVLADIAPVMDENKTLVSIAAGISTSMIQHAAGFACRVIRVMPNTPLQLGQGATAVSSNLDPDDMHLEEVCRIFAASGLVEMISEEQMIPIVAVNGSSPAYIYLLAQAVMESAAAEGIASDLALRLFAQTLIGSAHMLLESGRTPDELIQMVASKGGTTVAALDVFRERSFTAIVQEAMKACTRRAGELSAGQ